jgi:hypothetical protein
MVKEKEVSYTILKIFAGTLQPDIRFKKGITVHESLAGIARQS